MTIQFFHHGNTIGEVTMDAYDSEDDARIFAASSMRLPIITVLDAAAEAGLEHRIFNQDDEHLSVTAWSLAAAV